MHRKTSNAQLRADLAWFVALGVVFTGYPIYSLTTDPVRGLPGVLIALFMFATGVNSASRAVTLHRILRARILTQWERKTLVELQRRAAATATTTAR